MNAMKSKAYEMDDPDRVYGEIYEYDGMFWAEVIHVEDRLDWVTEKSPDFPTYEQAEAWLAERKVAIPRTAIEVLVDRILSGPLANSWSRLRESWSGGKRRGFAV